MPDIHRRILTDHKNGWALAAAIATTIERTSGVGIVHELFFRFSQVNNSRDKWVVFIRHPYEIITSGYHYHKISDEPCAVMAGANIYDGKVNNAWQRYPEGNMSEDGAYRDKLNSMSVNAGLEYEMRTIGRLTVEAMYHWGYYDRPNVLTVKFEDFANAFDSTIERIARFYEINDETVPKIVKACAAHDLRRRPKKEIQNNIHITNKTLEPFVYRKQWKPHHYNLAAELFPPDLLAKFGYKE